MPSRSLPEPISWRGPDAKLKAARFAQHPNVPDATSLVLSYANERRAVLREPADGRQTGLGSSTIARYTTEMRRWVPWVAKKRSSLLGLSEADLRAYAEELLAKGLKAQTVRGALYAARMLHRALRWCGLKVWIPAIPTIRDPVRPEDKRQPPPPHVHVQAVRDLAETAITSGDWALLRLAACVCLCGLSGLRVNEARHIRWDDLDLERRTVVVRLGKGGKSRTAGLPELTCQVLRVWHTKEPGRYGPVWVLPNPWGRPVSRCYLWRACRDWQRTVGLPGSTGVHVLRHGYAELLLERVGDITIVQKALGHSLLQTTLRYARRADSRKVEEAMQDLEV